MADARNPAVMAAHLACAAAELPLEVGGADLRCAVAGAGVQTSSWVVLRGRRAAVHCTPCVRTPAAPHHTSPSPLPPFPPPLPCPQVLWPWVARRRRAPVCGWAAGAPPPLRLLGRAALCGGAAQSSRQDQVRTGLATTTTFSSLPHPPPTPLPPFSLRAIDPERYAIVNEAAGGEVVEEIEESKAFYEVYDGAVYMNQVGVGTFLREGAGGVGRGEEGEGGRGRRGVRIEHGECFVLGGKQAAGGLQAEKPMPPPSPRHRAAPTSARSSIWTAGWRWCALQTSNTTQSASTTGVNAFILCSSQ
jgi:hypothetical protein